MSTRAAVGFSTDRDPKLAGRRAAHDALDALGGDANLALVFATVGYEQQALLDSISATLGANCVLAGCSGEGIIAGGDSHEVDHAVSVMAVRLEGARAEAHQVLGFAQAPEQAAQALAKSLGELGDVRGVLLFPDGIGGDCTRFLRALEPQLPGVTIVGGTAGDAMTFERTYQYCGREVHSGAASAVVLRGKGELRVAVSHGCTPCGPHQTITKMSGAWLERIDERPAWDVFKEFLDGNPRDLNAEGIVHICIGMAADASARFVDEHMIIRTPMGLNTETGAMLFPGGGLESGQRVRIARRDAEKIRVSGAACARMLLQDEQRPAFVIQFDCAGRGKVMFGDCAAQEIVEPLRHEIGLQVPWAGFHTYGEIAQTKSKLNYHNYTVALCAFHDA